MDLQWEDPPEHALNNRPGGQYRDFTAALRQNPQRWALLPGERASENSARSTLQNLRRGKMVNFPKGEFEAVIDRTKIYVRFIGETEVETSHDATSVEGPNGAIIRAWAIEQGMTVPARGRLSQDIVDAYMEQHPV